jgi:hypothetical protein
MAVAGPQPGLFDAAAPPRGPYFLTNRHNLLRILASSLVMPHSGFAAKYYDDLLRLAPGRLPLLARGTSQEICSLVTPEVESFPVLLELRPEAISRDAFPALLENGTSEPCALGNPDALIWAPTGVLPFDDAVSAIHFQSNRDREEFELREYADVRPRHGLHQVTPSLFNFAAPSADQLTTWLTALAPGESPDAEGISVEDRRAGALLLGATTSPATNAELLGWGQILTGKKPGRTAGESVARTARALDGAKGREPEDIALHVCLEVLKSTNRLEVWRPNEVIGAIRDGIQLRLKSDADAMIAALDRAEAIVRGDEPFEGLKAAGSPVMKALLLALLRPEPDRLVGWDPGGAGADELVLNLAAVLVGALTGRSLVPASMRPAGLDSAVARNEAERLSSGRERAFRAGAARPLKVERHDGLMLLKVGDETIVERKVGPTSVAITEELLRDEAVLEAAVGVAMKMGWEDSIETIVEAPAVALHTSMSQQAGQAVTIRFLGIGRTSHHLVADAFRAHADGGELKPEDAALLIEARSSK